MKQNLACHFFYMCISDCLLESNSLYFAWLPGAFSFMQNHCIIIDIDNTSSTYLPQLVIAFPPVCTERVQHNNNSTLETLANFYEKQHILVFKSAVSSLGLLTYVFTFFLCPLLGLPTCMYMFFTLAVVHLTTSYASIIIEAFNIISPNLSVCSAVCPLQRHVSHPVIARVIFYTTVYLTTYIHEKYVRVCKQLACYTGSFLLPAAQSTGKYITNY